jgi:1-deoxy-D-xylulose-5-phosphate reductoisomerase
MKRIILLGASGSIGAQTCEVVRAYPEKYAITAIAVHHNITVAKAIVQEFKVQTVVVFDETAANAFRQEVQGQKVEVLSGLDGLVSIARSDGDIVFNALVGSIGVRPTLEALKADKDVALANKETLVMAGELVMAAAAVSKGSIIPVDSEHSALMQCLEQHYERELKQVIITASGGSLRQMPLAQRRAASVEAVLAHPNWSMGAKITVDSATMMNKGFEVIEAHHLFAIPYDKILTMLHKESKVHALCEYVDGSILAHLGVSDMRIPIQYALTYPERLPLMPATEFNWYEAFTFNFAPMDFEAYPLLQVAYDVGKTGGSMPAVLNAANEVAVDAFLKKQIKFYQIETIIRTMLDAHHVITEPGLRELLAVDKNTRVETKLFIKNSHL